MDIGKTPPGAKKTVLLTGGAGVLGSALVEYLAPSYHLICLTHKSVIRHPLVECVAGDITRERFGWDGAAFAQLAGRLDWIIHSAAQTRLEGNGEEILRTNYTGTRTMLELAALAHCPLYHISTAFATPCDYYPGVAAETSYEAAKRQAEQLVKASGVRASIFRPSIIIGDSVGGCMPSFQGFHLTLALLMAGVLPLVPSPEQAFVDVIARDVVAEAIKAALDRELLGDDYYLSSGAGAPTAGAMLDLVVSMAARGGPVRQRPKCIDPEIFERLIKPVFLPTFPQQLQPVLQRAAQMCRYAALRSPLESSLPLLLGAQRCAGRDALDELRQSMAYLQPRLGALMRMLRIPPAMLGKAAPAEEQLA